MEITISTSISMQHQSEWKFQINASPISLTNVIENGAAQRKINWQLS
jgi:hypothetical protein